MRVIGVLLISGMMALIAFAQRPRSIDTSTDSNASSKTTATPAPQNVKAKYEGGVFGHNRTMEGTLSFDDTNRRLLFRNKQQKDVLFIPYDAVNSAFADAHKRRPAAATVASNVPYFGFPFGFIKTKVRYLTIQYSDPDTRVSGVTSFRLENKEILASVLRTLGEKTGMTTRGEVYIRKLDSDPTKMNP